MGRGYIAKL